MVGRGVNNCPPSPNKGRPYVPLRLGAIPPTEWERRPASADLALIPLNGPNTIRGAEVKSVRAEHVRVRRSPPVDRKPIDDERRNDPHGHHLAAAGTTLKVPAHRRMSDLAWRVLRDSAPQ